MKKIIFGVAMIATMILGTSCKNNGDDEPKDAKFKIEVKDITHCTAKAVITAQDTVTTYYANYYDVATIDRYGKNAVDSIVADLNDLIDYYNAYYKEYYAQYGMEWEDLTIADFLSHGSMEAPMTGLKEEAKYYVILIEMDATGKVNSELYKKGFETVKFQATSNLKLDITIDGTVATCVPSNNDEGYFFSFVTDYDLDSNEMTISEYADDDVAYYGEDMPDLLAKGTVQMDVAAYEEDGYVYPDDIVYVYGFGYKNGIRSTEVFYKTFKYVSPSAAPARHHMRATRRPLSAHSNLLTPVK